MELLDLTKLTERLERIQNYYPPETAVLKRYVIDVSDLLAEDVALRKENERLRAKLEKAIVEIKTVRPLMVRTFRMLLYWHEEFGNRRTDDDEQSLLLDQMEKAMTGPKEEYNRGVDTAYHANDALITSLKAKLEKVRTGLEIIVNKRQPVDNLMGDKDIAAILLADLDSAADTPFDTLMDKLRETKIQSIGQAEANMANDSDLAGEVEHFNDEFER